MNLEEADDRIERSIASGGGLPVTEADVEAGYVHDAHQRRLWDDMYGKVPGSYAAQRALLEGSMNNIPPYEGGVQGELFTASGERKVVTPCTWAVDHGDLNADVLVYDASGTAVVPESQAWHALLKKQAEAYARGEAAYQETIRKLTQQNEELRRVAHGAVKAIDQLHNDVRAVLPGGHRLSKRLTHWQTRLAALEG